MARFSLDRYPGQTRERRGLALTGCLLLVFGLVMALLDSAAGALIGIGLGLALLPPAWLLGEARFGKYCRWLAHLSPFGSIS